MRKLNKGDNRVLRTANEELKGLLKETDPTWVELRARGLLCLIKGIALEKGVDLCGGSDNEQKKD